MIAPVHRLKKQQIVWLGGHRCAAHSHTYLEHYNCFLREQADRAQERVGFLDIEQSNLDADYGQMLSYCIKDYSSDEILYGVINKDDIFNTEPGHADARITQQLIEDIGKFDKLVTWYGARFDLPFIRTRQLVNKIPFPTYGTIVHKDLYFTCKAKFKLSSNRLENACRVLLGESDKTRINPAYWHGALRGDKASLDYVLEHNKYDVLDLQKIYNKINEYGRPVSNSI